MTAEKARLMKRFLLFYAQHQWIFYHRTWFGKICPTFLKDIMPYKWLGEWKPNSKVTSRNGSCVPFTIPRRDDTVDTWNDH